MCLKTVLEGGGFGAKQGEILADAPFECTTTTTT